MKKEILIALSASALFLVGCVDSSTGAAARASMNDGDSKIEKKAETPKTEEKKAETPKAEEKKADTGVNLSACIGCHGANFEKKAMGVSKVVKDLSKDEIIKALKGYKAGTYGGSMKNIMKGQVDSFDDAKIEAIATKISSK